MLEKQILDIERKLLFSQENEEMNQFIKLPNEYIYMCCMIAFCRININSYKKVDKIVSLVKYKFPDIYKGQRIIYDSINLYGYDTPKKIRKAFNSIIRQLQLSDYVYIK